MAPALRLIVFTGMMCVVRGLQVIDSPDFNCSQPGILCSVLKSNCLDLSWIQPFDWTPTAPSHMEVTAGIGVNDLGYRVPVLQINWTVSIDASIRDLRGAEILVLEFGSGRHYCIQFQFHNKFLKQRDENNQAWKFFYNNFEVNPGNTYHISVQHLPKQEHENRKEQEFTAPGCDEDDMMQTDTCCRLGHCWNPDIALEFAGDKLIVTFTPRRGAHSYGVKVSIVPMEKQLAFEIIQATAAEREQVNISNPVPYEPCWYNVSVWPYMDQCENDCVRYWYAPKCPTPAATVSPNPGPPGPIHVWPIAAAVTITAFTVMIILLWCCRVCISAPGRKAFNQLPAPVVPWLEKQKKVWLVYSADHELYVNVVIRLADFLRTAWGLDVVVDRHQSQEIGRKGVMPWLSYQKDQIEKMNGTILILCSRGAQAKWRAMQDRQEERVTLPEDTSYQFGDLFTPALALILPDFQKAKPYDRYVVAYFSELCDVGEIPSPLEICPRYALTENLQTILFHIQRIERHQPNVQYNVDLEGKPSYRHLVKAVEQCRAWQETHSDWFGKKISLEESVEEEEAGHEMTRRVYPQIRDPETSVFTLTPSIIDPDPIGAVNPSLVVGPSSVCMVPLLNEEQSPVTVVQPSLEALRASYRQQPFLVDVDESLPVRNKHLCQMEVQDVQSEDLSEAQRRFFCQSILDQHMIPDVVFGDAESSPGSDLAVREPLLQMDLSIPRDHGVLSMDLREAQRKFFCQSILEDQAGAVPGMVIDGESLFSSEDASIYDRSRQMSDIPTNGLMEAQKKFFFHTIFDGQHLAPDVVLNDGSPLHEHRPLLVGVDLPLPSVSDPSRHNGQGSQFLDLIETQNNRFQRGAGQRAMPEMDVEELDLYEELNVLIGQSDDKRCHSEDLGYGTLNPNNLEAIKAE